MSDNSYDFTGIYEGEIDGVPTSLQLTQSGSNITGDINKNGLLYNVVGITDDNGIQGRMSDSSNIESCMLQAEINNGFLIIHLISHDLETRTISRDSYTFKKTEQRNIKQDTTQDRTIADLEFDLDPGLIGTWAREEILTSADNAISTQVAIELGSGGSYKLLGSISLKDAKDTGYSGDTTKGKWRTHNGTFYILVSGSKYWKPYAKYIIEDKDHMTFAVEDGERQNWVRTDQ
ncbi:MAG: hypothetical protein GWO07_07205 [Candidatus Dadabacteria bacterium]|nr:hypothetical protein [Candidatus Dadabacteria bacterium]NIS08536.1 hypothetical protein [Candidatus Dadabacteria bacterium]NIV41364.1 hypothetical protein [Candidatus Dadabacteria bacterium]NIX14571.1 hypothetical protein [Candidatus Dadabacteria bacterium]NIY21026.1 hypothetical protein [Candidatus Dadabacteria bacterium]